MDIGLACFGNQQGRRNRAERCKICSMTHVNMVESFLKDSSLKILVYISVPSFHFTTSMQEAVTSLKRQRARFTF